MKHLKKFEKLEDSESIECIINKIKIELMDEHDCGWETFINEQELGDCQSIVSSIMYLNIPGVEKHFGEISIQEPIDEDDDGKIMTHHWVTYNDEILEFSKGTMKEYVDWNDEYSVIDDGEINYDGEIKIG